MKVLTEGTSDAGGLGWLVTHNQTVHTVHKLADKQHHSKYLTQAQQGPESPAVTLTWRACTSSSLVEFVYLVFTCVPGELL